MAEKKPEVTPVRDLIKFLGLDYNPPKLATDCLNHAYGVIPFVRSGLSRLSSLGSGKH